MLDLRCVTERFQGLKDRIIILFITEFYQIKIYQNLGEFLITDIQLVTY